MTYTTAEYISELHREIEMRIRVYPGRVKTGKMSQAAADRKTEVIRSLAAMFHGAAENGIPVTDLRLPISGDRFPITSLEPHIREVEQEIQYRSYRIERLPIPSATREYAIYQIRILREILDILRLINCDGGKTIQPTLF